jgi:ABC-type sugar transport system ATPase subunit
MSPCLLGWGSPQFLKVMAKVTLQSIHKSFGPVIIIPGLDLEIESGEFVALVGPSGCGKSTLLRMVAGLEDPTRGTIRIGDRSVNNVSPKERGVAMVFQNYALYPHMTVRENLGFALKMSKTDSKEAARRIQEASEILGLQELLERRPSQLSGGQKQRVAMGRAMVRQPQVLLFDEPLSNLDAQLRIKVRSEIALLHKRVKSTVIYVTHDQVEAMTLADRIAILNKGNLEQYGTPMDVYHHPKTQFVASFIGTPPMNFLPAGSIKVNGPSAASVAGFRPEVTRVQSLVSKAQGGEPLVQLGQGRVSLVEPLGSTTHVHVRVGASMVVAEIRSDMIPTWDQEVSVWLDPKELFYFNSQGARI